MFEYLESISITEGEQIKKTIQALFRQTCILQVKYDPATLTPRDNPYYEVCTRHRNFIRQHLCRKIMYSMKSVSGTDIL